MKHLLWLAFIVIPVSLFAQDKKSDPKLVEPPVGFTSMGSVNINGKNIDFFHERKEGVLFSKRFSLES